MTRDLQAGIEAILKAAPVVPVMVIERVADAVPLARALVKGGLPVLEITLRTSAAIESIRAIMAEVKGAIVGVGTVITPAQMAGHGQAGLRLCRVARLVAACCSRPQKISKCRFCPVALPPRKA